MSVITKSLKGVSWLALFKFFGQSFAWITTILVSRVLAPSDYGLMAISLIITGYALKFNELGLGAAIIQKKKPTSDELSSVFWFSLIFSIFLSIICYFLSYFAAYIFNEQRVIPLAQSVSIIFILAGVQIVPMNLLKKELQFKSVGLIQMSATIISCIVTIFLAYSGAGIWTLIFGYILRSLIMIPLLYFNVKWLPTCHFSFQEAKRYIKFGATVAVGQSFYYIYEHSDRFFAGKAWSPKLLGYYSFALQLSQMPTEKIVAFVSQVSFPIFAKLKENIDEFNKFYLDIQRITITIVLPLYVGGYLVGDEMIRILLNEQWYFIIPFFKLLCLAQIIVPMNSANNLYSG